VDDGSRRARPEGGAQWPGVVVDDVELDRPLEAVEGMVQLVVGRPDELGRRILEDVSELRRRRGIPGSEERDVVTALDEAVREQRDDPLDAPVARRRDGKPDRAEDGDFQPQSSSTLTVPCSSCTFQILSKARTPASLSDPAQEGNSSGATVSSTCRP
jgi:hypothetical protein